MYDCENSWVIGGREIKRLGSRGEGRREKGEEEIMCGEEKERKEINEWMMKCCRKRKVRKRERRQKVGSCNKQCHSLHRQHDSVMLHVRCFLSHSNICMWKRRLAPAPFPALWLAHWASAILLQSPPVRRARTRSRLFTVRPTCQTVIIGSISQENKSRQRGS